MAKMNGYTHPDPVSTHILDTATGQPAAGVEVCLFRMGGSSGPGKAATPTAPWMKVNKK